MSVVTKAAAVDYETLDAVIQQLIAEADEENLHAFGAETIGRLAQDTMQPGLVTTWDLDEKGRLALADACQRVLTASPRDHERPHARHPQLPRTVMVGTP
ncbi:hypothetical protein ABZS66_59360 [Dactylosporangium sp. NPDC005572]|uniref:hypothetical protein n=1 Tax=Dactylosporangium sp. NPDC005572 TaxID=3156889 RepID=UPI0033B1DA96